MDNRNDPQKQEERERFIQELYEIFHGNEETVNAIMESFDHPEELRTMTCWEDLFSDDDDDEEEA